MADTGSDRKTDPMLSDPDVADDAALSEEPTLAEPSPDEIRDAADEAAEPSSIDDELADRDEDRRLKQVEPGAEGPAGTGIEGADDGLGETSDDAGPIHDASGYASDHSADLQSAAEQGNRSGDEMTSADLDDAEATDLAGDDLGVDALADDQAERVDSVDGLRTADGEPDER